MFARLNYVVLIISLMLCTFLGEPKTYLKSYSLKKKKGTGLFLPEGNSVFKNGRRLNDKILSPTHYAHLFLCPLTICEGHLGFI